MPDLEGSMYWVTEVQDASYITEPRRMRLENSQIARMRWLNQLPRVKTGDQTISSYDANKDAFIPRLVVAANIAEMDARDSTNDVRSLAPGLVVKVFMLRSNDGTPRYYFSGPATSVRQFKIIENGVHDQHLLTHTWDDETEVEGSDVIPILRPWLLQNPAVEGGYARGGVLYKHWGPTGHGPDPQMREATMFSSRLIEVVTPPYYLGDIITATRGIAGGLAIRSRTPLYDPVPDGIEWLADADGRAWAARVSSEITGSP